MTCEMVLGGFDEMEEALEDLEMAVGKSVIRRALKKSAQPMADLARSLVRQKSGNLAASITVSTKLSKRQSGIHRKMFRDDRSSIELFVGPSPVSDGEVDGWYGHLIEFGTGPHINKGKFAGSMHPGTAAQPFMRPAWDQDHKALLERLKVEMWTEIKKAMKRAERKAARLAAGG